MSSRSEHRTRGGGEEPRARSAIEYVGILRRHWLVALPVFLLVFAAVVVHTLFSSPVFEAHAVIQIEEQRSANDMLEAALSGGRAIIEAELQIMQSHRIAEGAVDDSGALAVILQENGHRPLESLLRQYGRGAPVCRLKVRLPVAMEAGPIVAAPAENGKIPDPQPVSASSTPLTPDYTRAYRLTFAEDGASFTLDPAEGGTAGSLGTFAFDPSLAGGSPFDADGPVLHLTLEAGRPAGRQFILRLRTRASAATWIERGIFVDQIGKRTGIVHLGFKCEDPVIGRDVANALTTSYLSEKTELKRAQLARRIKWLGTQIERVDGLLGDVLTERDEYIMEHKAVLLSEQAQADFASISNLLEQRLVQEQLAFEQRATLESLATTDDPASVMAAGGNGGGDALMQALANRLADLEVRRGALLRGGTKSDHPTIVGLDADIAESQKLLTARVSALREKVKDVLERRLDAIDRRLLQIRGGIERAEASLKTLPEKERKLAELARKVMTYEQSLAFLVRMEEEANIAIASTVIFAHRIDPARTPLSRMSPGLFGRSLAGIFLGLLAAMALALFRDARDQNVRTPQQLEEAAGLELYATIPAFDSVRRRDRRLVKSPLVAHDAPHSVLAECYRTLRANLRFADSDRPIQVFTITSATQGEGKTVTTLNLATVLAQGGSSVVVVDSDLRRPMVHTTLGGTLTPGLSEVLQGEATIDEALRESSVEGLSYLAAGANTADPGAMMETQPFADMMDLLKSRFDYVLFDVAPVLAVSDAASFFRNIDAVLLVCRAGRCPPGVVDGARRQIERLGGNLIGTILNAFDARRGGARGYGSQGYYGTYGYYGYTSDREPKKTAAKTRSSKVDRA